MAPPLQQPSKYRDLRKNIKEQLLDTGNLTGARTQLNQIVTEIVERYPDIDTIKDIYYGEKIMILHALNHLNAVIDRNDPPYIDTETGGQIKHQSDKVKSALLQNPKSDYSER